MQIRMQFKCQCSLHVILALNVHLQTASVMKHLNEVLQTNVHELVHVFDVNLITSNTTDEVHQAKLEIDVNIRA